MHERFLEFTQLGKSYDTPHGPAVIVKNFNLRMHEGEFVCHWRDPIRASRRVRSVAVGSAAASAPISTASF